LFACENEDYLETQRTKSGEMLFFDCLSQLLVEQLLSGLPAIEHVTSNSQNYQTDYQEHSSNKRTSTETLALVVLVKGSRTACVGEEGAISLEISTIS
jgi:hypothetical protein